MFDNYYIFTVVCEYIPFCCNVLSLILNVGGNFPRGKLVSSSHDLHGCGKTQGGDDPFPRILTYVTKRGNMAEMLKIAVAK